MNKIVFVVLHYETLNDTRNCLDSLLKYLSDEAVQIVAVDNGSTKGKLESLQDNYRSYPQIHFLYSQENLGFARGNNIGYRYAKYQLGADMIVLANNDLVFDQDDFVKRLREQYAQTHFDVAGPQIVSLMDGKNQNPVRVQYSGRYSVIKRLVKYEILYLTSIFNMDTLLKRKFSKEIEEFVPTAGEDFQLHGACLFFANNYLERFDGLYERTFMYGEEDFLKHVVKRCDLKMCYFEDVIVKHKEGSSTHAIWGRGKASRQFYYKWNSHSCRLLNRLMKKDDLTDEDICRHTQ